MNKMVLVFCVQKTKHGKDTAQGWKTTTNITRARTSFFYYGVIYEAAFFVDVNVNVNVEYVGTVVSVAVPVAFIKTNSSWNYA